MKRISLLQRPRDRLRSGKMAWLRPSSTFGARNTQRRWSRSRPPRGHDARAGFGWVREDQRCRKPQNPVAHLLEDAVATLVCGGAPRMIAPVNFHDQALSGRQEVNYEAADGHLPSELDA
jgi:hypothetical protein